MAKHELRNFTAATWESTVQNWKALIDEDAFELELTPALEWVKTHMEHVEGDSVALQLYNKDSSRTDAIVEIVTSRKGQMHKMLKVIPSPMFWDVDNQRSQIVELYIEVFVRVISYGGFKSDHKVKIYGRDVEMMSILRSIHSMWSIEKSKAEFEGRFLTITWE